MKSIRKRFLFILIGCVGSLFFVFALLLHWIMIHSVNHSINDNLLALAQRIALQIKLDSNQISIEEAEYEGNFPGVPLDHQEQRLQLYLQVWNHYGDIIYRSSSLKNNHISYMIDKTESVRFHSIFIPREPHLAVVWISFFPVDKEKSDIDQERISVRLATPETDGSLTLAVAIPRGAADEILRILQTWIVLISAFMIIFLVIMSRYFVEWTIKPITQIGEEIENISDRDLDKRLDESQSPIEVKPFVGKINSMLNRLEYMFQKEKQFTSDVSHELRTPLAAIRCSLDVAQLTTCNEPSHQRQMNETIKSVEDLQKLVEDLLTLCRADADTFEFTTERVDMAEIITESVLQIAPLARSHTIKLDWNPPQNEYPIQGDYHWLQRLCLNLLSNAIYYNKANGSIHIEIDHENDQVQFSVKDTGIGIPQEHLENIFERFYRVDPSRNSSIAGSGLGLSIVRWIIEAHNGIISVDSIENEGTKFRVSFPVYKTL
jgi:heavy metal sensor kinase